MTNVDVAHASHETAYAVLMNDKLSSWEGDIK
jgi:hypothetical protein